MPGVISVVSLGPDLLLSTAPKFGFVAGGNLMPSEVSWHAAGGTPWPHESNRPDFRFVALVNIAAKHGLLSSHVAIIHSLGTF